MSLPPSPQVAVEVLRAPGFPLDQFTISTKQNRTGDLLVHLAGCPSAISPVPVSSDGVSQVVNPCGCLLVTGPGNWSALLYAAVQADRTVDDLARLEGRSTGWDVDPDVDDFLVDQASLPLYLGPRLLGGYALDAQDRFDSVPAVRERALAQGDAATARAAERAQAATANLTERYLAAMSRWPSKSLWQQVWGSRHVDDPDRLVITTRGRLVAAVSGAEETLEVLCAVSLVSIPVLAHTPSTTGRSQDELLALHLPAYMAEPMHRRWLWSTTYPAGIEMSAIQAAVGVLSAFDTTAGGPEEELLAALAATV